ncbi:MAG: hypothetical protein COV46_08595 [Deltaproteobacteria bacterium CG11_big_fil_rev_8_21_14_0_20_49_13]|nr:MAG: hypothetical protein COV46_08595 [Deltaproteobacteria bacterium CG11_big_fil_rev_8_21_14_0_20_49_13]
MRYYIAILLLILGSARSVEAFDALHIMDILSGKAEAPQENNDGVSLNAPACSHGAMVPAKICEIGSGFLCVNTPPLSITEDTIMIKGTIDLRNNQISSLAASVQNEYTNEYKQLKFASPNASESCWSSDADYCLDNNGFYSIKVSLGDKFGPYAVSVSATRVNGNPATEKVRLSKVTDLDLSKEDIKTTLSDKSINVTIDLLHSCQFCDFIGTSTGGVETTVVNTITDSGGDVKQATERSNVASNGIFSLCLPAGNGTNDLTVSVCNATTGYDRSKCPTVKLDPISAGGGNSGIKWLTPVELFYSADINPTVALSFSLADVASDVKLAFNRDEELTLAPGGSDGTFNINLSPETGMNVGVIKVGEDSYPFAFGWGEIVSPFDKSGNVKGKEGYTINNAGGFSLSQKFWTGAIRGLANNYLRSDEFKDLLKKIPQMMDSSNSASDSPDSSSVEISRIQQEIPRCKSDTTDKNAQKFGFKMSRWPVLDLIDIPSVEFDQDKISFILNAENLKVWAQTFVDNNSDGVPDKRVLPLIIGFRKIFSPVEIKVDRSKEAPLFLLTGPSTDCEYKSGNACEHKPAILVPKDFIGNATKGGSFLACDEGVDKDCIGVNMLNGQTALISMTVLDTINDLLYCKGSALVTYIIREKIKGLEIPLNILGDREWSVPTGIDLLSNQFNVDKEGIWGKVPAVVGNEGFYSSFDPRFKNAGVGFIKKPDLSAPPSIASKDALSGGYDFGIGIGEDFINGLLFVLTEQAGNGLLDWDYHDIFLKKLEFDTVTKCDEFKPTPEEDSPPTICNLRPRVGELLGSALTANGYFQQKQPIMMRIRGNRALTPRVGFFGKDDKQYFDIQLGEVDVIFYALETENTLGPDRYGNLQIKVDANGDPVIRSMNPTDPDPENGPIVKFKLSALIALEISKIFTDQDDPSKFGITLRTDPALSKIFFRQIQGGNTTVISDKSLISALYEKINYGINIFAEEKNAIKFDLPKEVSLDQFKVLGLERLSFGKDGLYFGVELSQEYADILFKLSLTQTLTYHGEKKTFRVPE